MNPNDWASSDPTENITLTEADQFKHQLAAGLGLQFADRFVKTSNGDIVSDNDVRHRNPPPAAPVNLWGVLAGTAAVPVNVAQMRSAIRAAASSSNPVGELEAVLHHGLPKADVAGMLVRVSPVAAAIRAAISEI